MSRPPGPAPTGGLESQGARDARPTARFPCFDGLRAVAACMVLLVHASILSGEVKSAHAGSFLARMDSGVVVFFVISGFLLYRPFVVAHLGGAPAFGLVDFWRRRVLRIFPAYWLALIGIVYVLQQRSIHNARDAFTYFGLFQIYDSHRVLGMLSQAWTLCVEVSFYALLPLYAWALGRRAGASAAGQLRREWLGVAALFIGGLAFRLAVRGLGIELYVLNWLPAWMDMFALGMGLAIASAGADIAGVGRRVPAAIGRHPALCWVAAGISFWAVSTRLGLPNHTAVLDVGQELGQHYLYGLLGLCIVLPAVFGDQREGLIRAVLRSRVAVAIGVVSYGIYLWHIALIERIARYVHVSGPTGFVVLAVLGLAASYCVALVSYVVVERPALRLKGRPAPAPAPAST